MKRRSFIKTIAGSATAVLPLTSLMFNSARAASGQPIRTLFVYHPNGAVPELFHPVAGSMTLPAMTAPLEAVKQHCIFMDGFGLDGEGTTHEGGAAKVLTGNHASKDNLRGTSSSLEVLMGEENFANGLNPIAPSIQMGLFASKWSDKSISFQGSTRLPYFDDPLNLYGNLFSGNSSGLGSSQAQAHFAAFNVAKNDLLRLQRELNGQEKERLEMHIDAFATLEAKLNALANNTGGAACGNVDLSDIGSNDWRDETPTGAMSRIADAQQDIAIQAFSCDVTRAISFMYSHPVSPIRNPTGGMGDHDASHSDGQTHTQSKIWWMQQLAQFLQKLANTPDGPGTSLLDNTLVLAVSELGHGNYHDHWRMPFILAGGASTGLQTGRSLDFRGVGDKRFGWGQEIGLGHADLLQLIAQKAGYQLSIPLATGTTQGIW